MRIQTIVIIICCVAIGYFLAVTTQKKAPKPQNKPRTVETADVETPKRKKGWQTSEDRAQLERLLLVAERLQKATKWKEAADKYKEAYETIVLKNSEADLIRRKLDAVKNILLGQTLAKEKKWDEALIAYEAAFDDADNKRFLERTIQEIQAQQKLAKHYSKGDELAQQGRWAEARAAFKEALLAARQAGLQTDALDRMKEMDKFSRTQGDRKEAMLRTLDMCAQNGDYYAILAVCNYVQTSPAHAGIRENAALRKGEAAKSIAADPQSFPGLQATEDADLVTVRKKDAMEVEGTLVSEEGSKLVLDVVDGAVITRKMVVQTNETTAAKRQVTASELNEARAESLFTQAVHSIAREDYMSALRLVGALQHQFPESQAANNAGRQNRLIGTASPRVASMIGRTLNDLLKVCVREMGHTCLTCLGSKLVPCDSCKGTGLRQIKCMMCQGSGKVLCGNCGGTKKVLVGTRMVSCPRCKATGKSPCVPCKGTGQLVQGCAYCDASHMIKCPDCNGSGREKTKAHMVSTGKAPERPDSPKHKKARMEWLFDVCTAHRVPYGTVAAATFYAKHPDYKPFSDIITTRRQEAEAEIAKVEKARKQDSSDADRHTCDVIETTDGKTFTGKVKKQDEKAVTITVQDGEKTINRIVLRKSIRSMEKRKVGKEERLDKGASLELLKAARSIERQEYEKALSQLGKLLHSYADCAIVTDEEAQKNVVGEASTETLLVVGGTVNDLLAKAVKEVELTCIECEGRGVFPCDDCQRKGTQMAPCKYCRGAKRIFCKTCGGCGRDGETSPNGTYREFKCGTCNGTGWTNCPHCKNTGRQVTRCRTCNGACEIKCKECGGDGRMTDFPLHR